MMIPACSRRLARSTATTSSLLPTPGYPLIPPQMAEFLKAYEAKFAAHRRAMWAAPVGRGAHPGWRHDGEAGSTDGAAMAKVMEDNTWDLLTGQLDWEPADKGHERISKPLWSS